MSKLKKFTVNFGMTPIELLKDKNISMKAKGLFAFMQYKPDGWIFTIDSIADQVKEGRWMVYAALKELKDFGWVTYHKQNTGEGIYELHETPQNPNCDNNNLQKQASIHKILSKNDKINIITEPPNNFEVFSDVELKKYTQRYQTFDKQLSNEENIIRRELLYIQNDLKPKTLGSIVKEYNTHVLLINKRHETFKSWFEHFVFWLKQQSSKEKLAKYQNRTQKGAI